MSRAGRLLVRSRSPRANWLAWLCVACLLAVQSLGHWHGIAHGSKLLGLVVPVSQAEAEAPSARITDGWGHHSGDADCHVFDQLSHHQGLSSSSTLACVVASHVQSAAPIWAGAELAARWKRGARAPPVCA